MNYREETKATKKYKEEYLSGIENLIEKRQMEIAKKRQEYV